MMSKVRKVSGGRSVPLRCFLLFITVCVQLRFTYANENNPVVTLTRAEIEEIRHFASKAYGPNKQPAFLAPDSQGSFSHYVGRRMKPFAVQNQPFTVTMKRPALTVNPLTQTEQQTSGAVSTYAYLPAFRTSNHIAPPAPYSYSSQYIGGYNRPPAPRPRSKFFLRPIQPQSPQVFTFSLPQVYAKRPPPTFYKTSPSAAVAALNNKNPYTFLPVVATINNNKLVPVQLHHQAQIQAIMAHQHMLSVKEAQTSTAKPTVNLQVEEVKISDSTPKANEVSNEITTTAQPQLQQLQPQQLQLQLTQSGYQFPGGQQLATFSKYLNPNEYTVTQYGPAVPAILENNRFSPMPLRFEQVTKVPYTPSYQIHPDPFGLIYRNQGFPEYSFHPAPNANFIRLPSFIPSAPTTPATQTSTTKEQPKVVSTNEGQSPVDVLGEVIFESARIPEEVAISSSSSGGGGPSYGRNGPLTLTPQEQRNVFTAAADSSLVIAPLVYTQDLPSPISSTTSPLVVTTPSTQEPLTSISTSSEEVTVKPKPIYSRGKSRVREEVTSTVTRVLADGKRVRLRKVKKADKATSAEA